VAKRMASLAIRRAQSDTGRPVVPPPPPPGLHSSKQLRKPRASSYARFSGNGGE
jgi:hypothetical protein